MERILAEKENLQSWWLPEFEEEETRDSHSGLIQIDVMLLGATLDVVFEAR